jgi:hypothetical protein
LCLWSQQIIDFLIVNLHVRNPQQKLTGFNLHNSIACFDHYHCHKEEEEKEDTHIADTFSLSLERRKLTAWMFLKTSWTAKGMIPGS